jgi:hypothetical protein
MDWQSLPWTKLGWTTLFALIAGISGQASRWVPAGTASVVLLAFLLPSLAAAFLIGMRIAMRAWVVVSSVVVLPVGLPLLMIPATVASPYLPWPGGQASRSDSLAIVAALVAGLVYLLLSTAIVVALHALAARAGVRWGERSSHAP